MAEDSALFKRFGKTVETGETVFREGDQGDTMYIIQDGRVRVSKGIGGRQHILAELGKGEFFGEMAIVNNVKRTASITAIDKTELLCFTREGFLSMINKNPMIALNIIDKLCRRLQDLHLQIQHFARRDARGLVALNLLYAFNRVEQDENCLPYEGTVEEISLRLQLPMEEIRGYVEDFSKKAMLKIDKNRILPADREKLNGIIENMYKK